MITPFSPHQQLRIARMESAGRWVRKHANRHEFEDPSTFHVLVCLRRGLTIGLREALTCGNAGAPQPWRWQRLVAQALAVLPCTPEQREALALLAGLPRYPARPERIASLDEGGVTYDEKKNYHHAAHAALSACESLVTEWLGACVGRWLRHRKFGLGRITGHIHLLLAKIAFGHQTGTRHLDLRLCFNNGLVEWADDTPVEMARWATDQFSSRLANSRLGDPMGFLSRRSASQHDPAKTPPMLVGAWVCRPLLGEIVAIEPGLDTPTADNEKGAHGLVLSVRRMDGELVRLTYQHEQWTLLASPEEAADPRRLARRIGCYIKVYANAAERGREVAPPWRSDPLRFPMPSNLDRVRALWIALHLEYILVRSIAGKSVQPGSLHVFRLFDLDLPEKAAMSAFMLSQLRTDFAGRRDVEGLRLTTPLLHLARRAAKAPAIWDQPDAHALRQQAIDGSGEAILQWVRTSQHVSIPCIRDQRRYWLHSIASDKPFGELMKAWLFEIGDLRYRWTAGSERRLRALIAFWRGYAAHRIPARFRYYRHARSLLLGLIDSISQSDEAMIAQARLLGVVNIHIDLTCGRILEQGFDEYRHAHLAEIAGEIFWRNFGGDTRLVVESAQLSIEIFPEQPERQRLSSKVIFANGRQVDAMREWQKFRHVKLGSDCEGEDSVVTAREDDSPLDSARAAMLLLQESEIAGLPFHRAKAVAARLVRGMRLQLAREPDNAYDTEAVAILMDSGEKLGYVPRRCNVGIARRLDAGVGLGIWLTHVAWDRDAPQGPTPWRIGIEIRSANPNDVPDEKLDDRPTPDNEATVTTPAATPAMRRAARSYWPFKFAFGAIEKARAALGRNAPGEMLNHVDTAYKWAQEAWLFQHDLTPDTGKGWLAIGPQFNQATRDTGLGGDFSLLKHELIWRVSIPPAPARDTALALCLLRIESLWHQHLAEVDAADLPGGGGVSFTIGLPPPPPLRPPPDIPLARRYSPLRRIEALRPLRRLLRVIQRVECQLPASTAGLRCLRLFNRDRTLVRATLRQLAHVLREQLRDLFKPNEAGTCWEPDEHYARLFPCLIPNTAKWSLVNEAVSLLEQEPPDPVSQRALLAQLYLLQPETHRLRRGRRRRATDHDLFVAEQLLNGAESLDMLDIVNGTCLLMPMDRRNRLRAQPLWQLFDALCVELFGKRRMEMLHDFPSLLAEEAPPLDFAIEAWRRAVTEATDAGDPAPAERAARTLLLEALVGHPGRWTDDLESRIPALARVCAP